MKLFIVKTVVNEYVDTEVIQCESIKDYLIKLKKIARSFHGIEGSVDAMYDQLGGTIFAEKSNGSIVTVSILGRIGDTVYTVPFSDAACDVLEKNDVSPM